MPALHFWPIADSSGSKRHHQVTLQLADNVMAAIASRTPASILDVLRHACAFLPAQLQGAKLRQNTQVLDAACTSPRYYTLDVMLATTWPDAGFKRHGRCPEDLSLEGTDTVAHVHPTGRYSSSIASKKRT